MISDTAILSTLSLAIGISSGAVALYVRSSVMELRVELQSEIFLMKEDIIKHINTSYVRKESCVLREDAMRGILERLHQDINRDAHKCANESERP